MPHPNLPYPERHRLNAARGWLELGDLVEAEAELGAVVRSHAEHPEVLETRWLLGAARREWSGCVETAQRLTELAPDRPSGWIHLSYALHELGRTQEAFACLLPKALLFPGEVTMPYNLACYASRLGHFSVARMWLALACSQAEGDRLLRTARADPDLAPYWKWLAERGETDAAGQ